MALYSHSVYRAYLYLRGSLFQWELLFCPSLGWNFQGNPAMKLESGKGKITPRYFRNKGPSSHGYGFSRGHVWMRELDYKES